MAKKKGGNLNKGMLRARGWTEPLIRQHLGKPHTGAVAHGRNGPFPMPLWSRRIVEEIEKRPEVRIALQAELTKRKGEEIAQREVDRRLKLVRDQLAPPGE